MSWPETRPAGCCDSSKARRRRSCKRRSPAIGKQRGTSMSTLTPVGVRCGQAASRQCASKALGLRTPVVMWASNLCGFSSPPEGRPLDSSAHSNWSPDGRRPLACRWPPPTP
eukprot:5901107-Prymnesium_polylepis.1